MPSRGHKPHSGADAEEEERRPSVLAARQMLHEASASASPSPSAAGGAETTQKRVARNRRRSISEARVLLSAIGKEGEGGGSELRPPPTFSLDPLDEPPPVWQDGLTP